ncbi:DMT family transporter [uncultured Cohaesibacter sp.]|uniref:DMT family transporter n=1 Tax=uncultured Cohaesibacter sp. TaxID=1002546 RepID=UPI00292E498D|nr:DMT family transporter [uncultured Cohaesibacter sp.]
MSNAVSKRNLTEGDNPLLGVLLMMFFCMFIPFADALMKLLGETVPVMTVLVARFAIQVFLMGIVMLVQRGGISHILNLSGYVWKRLGLRSINQIAGISAVYIGLQYLPVADNTAICFVYPILMLITGHIVMKEHVGPHRIVASLVGFLGTLLVVQPNFMAVGANAFWPLGVAFTFVIVMMVTRQVSREIDPVSIQVVTGLLALVILGILHLLFGGQDYAFFEMAWPNGREVLYLVGAGIIGSLGHLVLAFAVRFAPSSTLAPMQYLEIPFATLIGWWIFSDLPNQLAAWGIGVTIASGLYIVYREQKVRIKHRSGEKAELALD